MKINVTFPSSYKRNRLIILKRFLIYSFLQSLITAFIFYTILTTYLSKTFNQLEEEVDSIILEVTLKELKEEINENVDTKLENLGDKLDSLNNRIDELYLQ